MWRRHLRSAVAGGAGVALALGICAYLLLTSSGAALASHSCGDTGSPFGPFALETYEAGDYRTTYNRALELAGFNQLFPEIPSFALPRIETGGRAAGSEQTGDPYIPPVLLKAIAWIESGWAQADSNTPYGALGPTLISHDCGYGIMQVTSGMQNVSGVPNLEQAMIGGHYAFNMARGAKILADKWNQAPEFRPIVGDRDPGLIENWYFALWSYNGFAFKNHPLNPDYPSPRVPYSCGPADDGFGHDRGQYPYQELVLGCVAHPPVKNGTPLWEPQEVHLPDLSDPRFAEPLKLENWNACAYEAQCAPMDIPTPNTNHRDPTVLSVERSQVLGTPALTVTGGAVSMEAVPGSETLPVFIGVSNSGTGALAWRAVSSAPWLRMSHLQGVSLGSDLGNQSKTIKVYADARGLTPGTYTGTVTIESLFAAGAPVTIPVSLYVSIHAASPRTADITGDGRADVVYLCCSDYASTWTTSAGGGFTPRTYSPWPGYGMRAGTWRLADFNGDGRTDLLHLCCSDYAHPWLANDDGSFSVSSFQPWPDYGMAAGSWLSGDFNGDGKGDLFHNCCSDYAQVWTSNGDGSFALRFVQPWPGYNMQAGTWQTGDFNGDGRTDLLHFCCSDYVHTWTSNGDGTFNTSAFRPWPDYGVRAGTWQTGDFNGDGRTDLAHLCCSDYVHTWTSNGDGTFNTGSFRPWPDYGVQAGTWQTGDFNGDGRTDLLHFCCRYVHLWRAQHNGSFAIETVYP